MNSISTTSSARRPISVNVRIGEVTPAVCKVDQPHGHTAGELLAESQQRLVTLLVQQHAALPAWANDDAALAHEIETTLSSIQALGAAPADRCVA